MDNAILQEKAIKNARSSISMEGLYVSDEMIELCKQVLNGEKNINECFEQLKKKK